MVNIPGCYRMYFKSLRVFCVLIIVKSLKNYKSFHSTKEI